MEECRRRDIRDLLIPGDITEGLMPRDGHPQQRFLDGIDEIHEYTNEVFDGFVDQFDSISVINGNHDESLNGRSYGFDVAYNLSKDYRNVYYNKEPDSLIARYRIPGGLYAVLHHGSGGCAQNLTTRTRNVSGKLFNYSSDWDLLVSGHCHSRSSDYWLGKYAFSVGAFQSMTPYLADKMLIPQVEGLILTYQVRNGSMVNVVPEVISYDHCLKRRDYPRRFK